MNHNRNSDTEAAMAPTVLGKLKSLNYRLKLKCIDTVLIFLITSAKVVGSVH